MTSKLETARTAVDELRKAIALGEDVSAEEVKGLDFQVIQAQNSEIAKSLTSLTKQVEELKPKADEDEDKDKVEKQEKPVDDTEDKDEEKSEMMDMALSEIVRLRKENALLKGPELAGEKPNSEGVYKDDEPKGEKVAGADKGAEALRKQEPKGEEEEEKVEKQAGEPSEAGPAEKLPKPASTDIGDSAEETVKKQEGEDEKEKEDEMEKAIQKAVNDRVEAMLKQAGFVASSTPIVPTEGREATKQMEITDLEKAVGDFTKLSWQDINRFRMQVDPALQPFKSQFTRRAM